MSARRGTCKALCRLGSLSQSVSPTPYVYDMLFLHLWSPATCKERTNTSGSRVGISSVYDTLARDSGFDERTDVYSIRVRSFNHHAWALPSRSCAPRNGWRLRSRNLLVVHDQSQHDSIIERAKYFDMTYWLSRFSPQISFFRNIVCVLFIVVALRRQLCCNHHKQPTTVRVSSDVVVEKEALGVEESFENGDGSRHILFTSSAINSIRCVWLQRRYY